MGWPVAFICGQLVWERKTARWPVAFAGPYSVVRMWQMCDSHMKFFIGFKQGKDSRTDVSSPQYDWIQKVVGHWRPGVM